MRIGWFLYHVASGHAFFTGLVLLAAAVALAWAMEGRWRKAVPTLAIVGALFIAISATPLPWLLYGVLVAALLVWWFAELRRMKLPQKRVAAARILMITACLASAAFEIPYHLSARLPPAQIAQVAVIADSVTAGIGENEAVTWPRLLAHRRDVVIRDHSQMGATVASARKQAAKLQPEDTIVILEIGGNDLLGGTTSADFAAGLESLLQDITTNGRTVVMFELPLPPSFNAYGIAQRRLARSYGAVLIPKRVLMGVFARSDATLDSIHLSQSGHERMSEAVWRVIEGAFQASKSSG